MQRLMVGALAIGGTVLAVGAGLVDSPESAKRVDRAPAEAAVPAAILGEARESITGAEPGRDDAPLLVGVPDPPPLSQAPPYLADVPEDAFRTALAYQFDTPVFERANAARDVVGLVRRDVRLPVARIVNGEGCDGTWYEVAGPGYVCSSEGFSVSTSPTPLEPELVTPPPAVDRALPYGYAKVETQGAPSFSRMPSPQEEAQALEGGTAAVRQRLEGAIFVAIDEEVEDSGRRFVRTVRGQYVRQDDLRQLEPTRMHGELLGEDTRLPLAFVHVEEAPLLDVETQEVRGAADKHARFGVDEIVERDGTTWVITEAGFAIDRASVRIADVVEPHERIPEDAQWIHVNLGQQTLVAYEGRRPVMATLVSAGKEGFEPPLGVFRVHKKYVTRTMSGPDPDAGRYEVAQVPWTMYYWGSYALHGAYWHDDFGNVRSHGCTNIPPRDARWLFYWAKPRVPAGWHATIGRRGPWIYFTG